jgi:hypothetical protein
MKNSKHLAEQSATALSRDQLEQMAAQIGGLSAIARSAELGLAAQLLDKAHQTIRQELGLVSPRDGPVTDDVSAATIDETAVRMLAKQRS